MNKSHACLIALCLTILTSVSSAAQSPLDSRIKKELSTFKGKVSLFAKNIDTGETYALAADERVRTASTIKIAVMVEAFARVAEGKARWTDQVVLEKQKKVSGSGVLQELSDGLQLSLRDAVNLMMLVSDNTATNLVLDVIPTDAVNARMEAIGFNNIKILRKVFGGGDSAAGKIAENKKYGLGFATSREMVLLMEKIERGQVVNPEASKAMIELMKREQVRYAIGRSLWEVPMASKYGALDKLRSCIAILYTKKGRIAIAITVDEIPEVMWSVDNPGYLLMSRLSAILVESLTGPSQSASPKRHLKL
jgi:beta-lactamase class A